MDLPSKAHCKNMPPVMVRTIINTLARHVVPHAVPSFYAGSIAIDPGDDVTHTNPIYEDYNLPHTILRLDLVEWELINSKMKILPEHVRSFGATVEHEIARGIKENKDLLKSLMIYIY